MWKIEEYIIVFIALCCIPALWIAVKIFDVVRWGCMSRERTYFLLLMAILTVLALLFVGGNL